MLTDESRDLILSGYAQGTPIKRFGLKGRGEVFIVDESCVRLIDRASRFLRKDASFVLFSVPCRQPRSPTQGHLLIRRAPYAQRPAYGSMSKASTWIATHDQEHKSVGSTSACALGEIRYKRSQ